MAIRIKHLAGSDQTIDDDTTIVRYMKLSTFLLLLADRVFLPSLRCLQSEDKLEALIPRTVWYPYGEHVQAITIPFEKWLLDHARGPTYTHEPGRDHNAATLSLLAKIWLEQLSVRRCVWCWNWYTGQSHALWKIYGQRGVAILTTIGIVKGAFARLGPFRSIVSPVSYSIPRSALYEHEVGTSFRMIQKENRLYPYLFKDAGYKYEEEIRFVFGVHPNLLVNANGIVTEIDGKSLLQGAIRERLAFRILISPEIPWDERVVIRRLVADILAGVRSAPIYPEGPDEKDWKDLRPFPEIHLRRLMIQPIFLPISTKTDVVWQRLRSETNYEKRAALIWLLTAALADKGTSAIIGEAEGGWFWLPPWSLWQPCETRT